MGITIKRRDSNPSRHLSDWCICDAMYEGYMAKWRTKSGAPFKTNFISFLLARESDSGRMVKAFTVSMDAHPGSEFMNLCVSTGAIPKGEDMHHIVYKDVAAELGEWMRTKRPIVLVEFGQRSGGHSVGILTCKPAQGEMKCLWAEWPTRNVETIGEVSHG